MIERCPNAGAAFFVWETTVAIEAVVIIVAIVSNSVCRMNIIIRRECTKYLDGRVAAKAALQNFETAPQNFEAPFRNFQKPFGKSEVRFVAPKHRFVFHVKGGNNGKGMGEKGSVG